MLGITWLRASTMKGLPYGDLMSVGTGMLWMQDHIETLYVIVTFKNIFYNQN